MEVKYIGWNNKDNHDKVWGVVLLRDVGKYNGQYLTFWGRRGAKLQTRVMTVSHDSIISMCGDKSDKGYKEIAKHEIHRVYSSFNEDIEKAVIWASLRA